MRDAMDCPGCGQPNPEDAGFCGECGSALALTLACPACGREGEPGQKFCHGCGGRLGESAPAAPARDPSDYTPKHLAEKILHSKSALEGERKQVTVLFADIKGSLDLAEQIDPEEWHRILNRFFEILAEGVHRFEGTINQYTGDGIMALFGAPIAHEDHAQRACYAALHLRDELRAYGDKLRRRGLAFSVRMGLNSGEVVVGKIGDDLRMDYTAQGQTVGLAARVQQLAEAGGACLTQHTARLVEGYFQLRDLGPVEIRGLGEPVGLHELEAMGALRTRFDVSRARGLSHFVGRSEEMATLDAALEHAVGGRGQVVGVVADAGTGKSRLCFEFSERCRARGVSVNVAHAVSHGKSIPLLPVLHLLRETFGISERESEQTARDKIAGRMLLLDEGLRDVLPLMFEFLGVPDPERPAPPQDPEIRQKQLFEVLARLTQARSRREPAVFLFEDLHWLDAASEDFLANLVESVPSTRTLLLVNFRPEYQAPWVHRSYYQQLPLVPLGDEAVDELLGHLLGRDPSLAGLTELVRERTGGNPFFVEEVVHALVESGGLEGSRGAYRLVEPVHELALPETVESLLAARIDRLPEREKQLLQSASVLGKTFARAVLERVADLPDVELEEALRALLSAEFLYEESLYPSIEYSFRHPLTQEVAAHSQLKERRARVHAGAARAVEALHPDRADAQAALIAHHWDEAGETLPAARWHGRAAEWAGANHVTEAMRHWRRVIDLVGLEPDSQELTELGVEARSRFLSLVGRTDSVEDQSPFIEEGRILADRSHDPSVRARYLFGVGTYSLFSGSIARARELLAEAIRLAGELDDRDLDLAGRYYQLVTCVFSGSQEQAIALCDEFVERSEGGSQRAQGMIGLDPVAVHAFRALFQARIGRGAEAAVAMARALENARQIDDPYALQISESMAAWLAGLLGDAPRCHSHAQRAVEIAERVGVASVLGVGYRSLAEALLAVGRPQEAAAALEQVFERGAGHARVSALPLRAATLLELGRPEEALESAESAIAETSREGVDVFCAETHVVRARAILRVKGVAAAEEVEAALARAEELIEAIEFRMLTPHVHLVRADLARARGDETGREREVREARRLFTEMGAHGHAERLAQELDT